VEGGRPAHRQADNQQNLTRVIEQSLERALAALHGFRRKELVRLVQVAPHGESDQGQQLANPKRDAPTPRPEFRGGQEELLQQEQQPPIGRAMKPKANSRAVLSCCTTGSSPGKKDPAK